MIQSKPRVRVRVLPHFWLLASWLLSAVVEGFHLKPTPPVSQILREPKGTEKEDILDRRSMLKNSAQWTAATATLTAIPRTADATITKDSEWPLWTALPVAPYARRKTIRKKVTDGVWTFDQLIGIYYVHVPIRMTVTALSDGLFVYAPVAPTKECLSLLQPLIDEYGPVRTILLPSVAVEHKVNAGPFARAFPSADFYATDKQYSFPLNLPNSFLGLPPWTKPLPMSSQGTNIWNGELEHEVLDVKPGPGSEFQDVAVWHKKTGTVMLCDTLIAVNDEPPAILTEEIEYTRALLFHARDAPTELVEDTPANRRKGWRRIVLLFNFFFPGAAVVDLGLNPLLSLRPYEYGWLGWLPFSWKSEEAELKAFDVYKDSGKPTVFPIVQIILSRGNSGEVLQEWLNKVSKWKFHRVIPAHLDAPIAVGPSEFVDTFVFLRNGSNEVRFCDEDVTFLRKAEESFLNFSVFKSNFGTLRGPKCGL